MIGMPECDVLLGQCTIYLAKAPKSRSVYNALKAAENIILGHKGPQPAMPLHIRRKILFLCLCNYHLFHCFCNYCLFLILQ